MSAQTVLTRIGTDETVQRASANFNARRYAERQQLDETVIAVLF